jgi:hypothetical protein
MAVAARSRVSRTTWPYAEIPVETAASRLAAQLAERDEQHREERVGGRVDDEEHAERVGAERQDRAGDQAADAEAEVGRSVVDAQHVLAQPVVDRAEEEREHPDPRDPEAGPLEARGDHGGGERVDRQERERPDAGERQPADRRERRPEPVGGDPGHDRADQACRPGDCEREARRRQAEAAALVQEDDDDRQRHAGADLEDEDAPEEPPGSPAERRERASQAPDQGA